MAYSDDFSGIVGADAPARSAEVVTPSDSQDLAFATRAIYVGGAGDLRVTMLGGQTVTFTDVPPPGLPLRVTRVWATGTTATGIIGLR